MKLGLGEFSCLIRQRTRRRAWRGRSSRADSRASSLRISRAALTRPSADGGREAAGCRPGRRPQGHQFIVGVEHVDARDRPLGFLRRGSTMRVRGSKSWKEGARVPALPWFYGPCPPGAGRCGRNHKTPCRNDNQAAQGGFGGPENAQHGAVGRPRKPRNRSFAHKPQHGKERFNDPCSTSLLRLMAKSQSMCFLIPIKNKTGT